MKSMMILNRVGRWETMVWDYDPEKNPKAKKMALEKLKTLNVKNAIVYEVAPECFFYKTPEENINVKVY